MNWTQLLSPKRFSKTADGGPLEIAKANPYRTDFESDYDRVAYSTPFRRLARKTQVHPLALNDHIHTRLTHSLEVASVGRSLARRLSLFLAHQKEMPDTITGHDIEMITQSACLAHDIGNPPFGHAGEFAIREWTSTHTDIVFGKEVAVGDTALRNDLLIFEGNAQGVRLAARGDNGITGYMRLTLATIGAMVKYPWDSADQRAVERQKFNFFSTELNHFKLLQEELGLTQKDGTCARHPLSFLTEAADDICYRILDIEDAVEMRIASAERVREIFKKVFDADQKVPLAKIRGFVIAELIEEAWRVFVEDYNGIMDGSRQTDLKSDFGPKASLAVKEIKTLYEEIFADRTKVAAELGAYKALGRILRALCEATRRLAEKKKFDDAGFLSKRCLELAWGSQYARVHEAASYSWWLHQVVDFVSGLTDNYARQLSREIEGT